MAQTTASLAYTNNGQVATLTDARSSRTTYEYDGHDRLWKLRYPHPSTPNESSTEDYEQFTFDGFGRPNQERRRSGDLFAFTWDNLGRITLRNAPGTQPDVSFGYDLLSRETSRNVNELTTAYDALSRVTSVTSSVLGAVSYQYDAAGRRTRMEYPGGFYVTYGYNTAGDLTGVLENGSSSLATYVYDDLGRRTSLTRGNGVVTSYTFDALSRLASLVQNAGGSSHDTAFTFDYNPSSQITSRGRTNDVFDGVSPPSFSDSYTANGLNQYTNADGVTPTYDTRGNLTNDGTKTYGYDYDNRMTSVSGGVTLKYDPASRLHEVAGAATTRFLYDGADLIAEYNGSGSVLRRYVHGPGVDEPLVWYEGSGTSDKRYLMADERGSVIGVTNAAGNVTTVNTYDAYGVRGSTNDGRFQYTGQVWLSELSLYHYMARAYDPKLGRFLQTDPIGTAGGLNLYAYVGADPVNFTDPSGLDGWCGDRVCPDDWWNTIAPFVRNYEYFPGSNAFGSAALTGTDTFDVSASGPPPQWVQTSGICLGGCHGTTPEGLIRQMTATERFWLDVGAAVVTLPFGGEFVVLARGTMAASGAAKATMFASRTAPELKAIYGWGKGLEGVKAARVALDVHAMARIQGSLSRVEVEAARDLYRTAVANGRGGQVAVERMAYMEDILGMWK